MRLYRGGETNEDRLVKRIQCLSTPFPLCVERETGARIEKLKVERIGSLESEWPANFELSDVFRVVSRVECGWIRSSSLRTK